MPSSNLKSLIGKLNETCRQALESAAGLCLSQTHYEVDIEHFLLKLLEIPNTDVQQILRHFEVNQDRLTADLTRTMDGFKTGNSRTPALSCWRCCATKKPPVCWRRLPTVSSRFRWKR